MRFLALCVIVTLWVGEVEPVHGQHWPGPQGCNPDVQPCCPGLFYCPGLYLDCTRRGRTADSCESCSPGTYAQYRASTQCDMCSAGKYAVRWGATSCSDCPNGRASSARGSPSVQECLVCEPGSASGGSGSSQCSSCGFGTYSSARGAGSCTTCSPGRYSQVTASTSSDSCEACPTGSYCATPTAPPKLCDEGTYAASPGLPACTLCPGGTSSTNRGATNSSVCRTCAAGRYCPRGSASPKICPTGSFCGARSQYPSKCPPGTFSSTIGAVGRSTCKVCPVGHFCGSGSVFPKACRAGTWSDSEGAQSCNLCVGGTSSTKVAATWNSTCVPCGAGYYCPPGSAHPLVCPAGKYNSEAQQSSLHVCIDCPMGKYSPTMAATTESTCLACPEKYYCKAGSSEPGPCPKGMVCRGGDADPEACDSTMYVPETGPHENECVKCPGGYSCTDGLKFLCPENAISKEGDAVCTFCTQSWGFGTIPNPGHTKCLFDWVNIVLGYFLIFFFCVIPCGLSAVCYKGCKLYGRDLLDGARRVRLAIQKKIGRVRLAIQKKIGEHVKITKSKGKPVEAYGHGATLVQPLL